MSASRKLPFYLSSFALFAFWFGSETVFGASAQFVEHGLLGVIEDPFGAFLCLILFAAFLVRPLYRKNILTLADLFRDRYGRKVELLASVMMLFTFLGYIAAQLIALSILFESVFGIESHWGILLSAAIVTLYTTSGGMWAVSVTDFVQSIVIIAGLILLVVILTPVAGDVDLLVPPKEDFFRFTPMENSFLAWSDYLAAWLAIGLGSLASQDIFQRANAARTEKIAVYSTYFGAFLYLLMAMLPLFLGMLTYHIAPELIEGDKQYVLMELIKGYAPFWLQVLFYGALISAIFSTSSGALLAPSSILAENIIKPLFLSEEDDKVLLTVSRVSVIFVAIISTAIAFNNRSIYHLVAESSILGLVSLLVPMLGALFLKRVSASQAVWSMVLGMATYVIFGYWAESSFPAMFLGLIASVVGFFFAPKRQIIVRSGD
jgi:SSS family transporter